MEKRANGGLRTTDFDESVTGRGTFGGAVASSMLVKDPAAVGDDSDSDSSSGDLDRF